MAVKGARDIEHAPTQRLSRSVRESTVVIKVEDTPRARTQSSRTDRWQDVFELAVDNANEIEVTVYDKIGSGHPVPVGMLWIRISDIVEELRKKKFGQPGAADGTSIAPQGWVTADDVRGGKASGTNSPAGHPSSRAQAAFASWATKVARHRIGGKGQSTVERWNGGTVERSKSA